MNPVAKRGRPSADDWPPPPKCAIKLVDAAGAGEEGAEPS